MRYSLGVVLLLFASAISGADDAPKASGILDGKKLGFPAKGIANGVKSTIGLLESCSDESLFQAEELKKAEQGDHVRLILSPARKYQKKSGESGKTRNPRWFVDVGEVSASHTPKPKEDFE